ncbi:MAG: hypothetical protein AAFZ80_10695 [Cyanobacteria bacterium P01_A01_bin.105]
MSLPLVVNESQASLFSFYHQGCLYQGMTFQHEVYMHIRLFTESGRLKAYALADYLQETAKVLIIVSQTGYRIGVALHPGVVPSEMLGIAYDLEQSLSSLGRKTIP